MEDDGTLIRRLEKELLDQQHRKYKILLHPSHISIPYILKNLGDIHRDVNLGFVGASGLGRKTFWTTVLHATGYCLRWALESQHKKAIPFTSHDDLTNQAGDLLSWAVSYTMLATDHIAWSRGLLQPHLDRERRLISFQLPQHIDNTFLLSQHLAFEKKELIGLTQRPLMELQTYYHEWKRKSHLGFRERLSSFIDERIPPTVFQLIYSWLRNMLFPELAGDFFFGKYTLEEFRRIYAALFIVSQFQAWDEESIDLSLGPDNFAGSVVVRMHKKKMIAWLSRMGHVRFDAAKHFIEDLTLNTRSPRSTLSTKFFVQAHNEDLFFLARLPAAMMPDYVLSSILTDDKYSQVYDRLVEQFENLNVEILESVLRPNPKWKVFRKKALKLKSGAITPDLILTDDKGAILIIEYKHVLTPLSPTQVASRVKNYSLGREGIKQVMKYVNGINEDRHGIAPQLGLGEIREVTGLILFGNPMPIPLPESPDVFKIDKNTLEQYIATNTDIGFDDLVEWVRALPNNLLSNKAITLFPREIQVSEWTYVHWLTAIEN